MSPRRIGRLDILNGDFCAESAGKRHDKSFCYFRRIGETFTRFVKIPRTYGSNFYEIYVPHMVPKRPGYVSGMGPRMLKFSFIGETLSGPF